MKRKLDLYRKEGELSPSLRICMENCLQINVDTGGHKKQEAVLGCTKPRMVAVCGRRAGKTTVSMMLLLKRWALRNQATGKPGKYWYIAPTLKQAKDIVWNSDMLFKYFPSTIIRKRRDSDFFIELIDGTTIQLKSCQDYADVGLLKGSGLDGVVIDEFDQMPKALWSEAIEPSLVDKSGWSMFIGTPDAGFGNLYELYHNAQTKEDLEDEWQSFNWTLFDNPFVPEVDKERIRRDKATGIISDIDWEIQYMGHFAQHAGAVYEEFNLEKHVFRNLSDIPTGCLNYIGIDYGFNDPFVALWAAVDGTGCIYIYREHYVTERPLSWHAERIARLTGQEKIQGVFVDPSAKGMQEELKEYGSPLSYARNPFRDTEAKEKRIYTGITRLKDRLREDPVMGKPTIYIHTSCTNTIKEFQQYHWQEKDGTSKDVPADEMNHAMDVLRYLIAGIGKGVKKRKARRSGIIRRNPLL